MSGKNTSFSEGVQNARLKNLQQQGPYFTIANSLFSKAFYIAWNVCKGKEEISSYEFARQAVTQADDLLEFQNQDRTGTSADGFTYRNRKIINTENTF
ncbi:MAG: hypothetical protein MZV63_22120 [Marinilabiliales bacterium]|nr:hypothetical protein [Marinilabiliales bacterium]